MFKRILLAVDGSDASQKAMDWAINAHRELQQAQFTILYVHQPYVVPIPDAFPLIYGQVESEIPKETPSYETWKQFPERERVSYETLVGNPAEVICREANTGGYDVIVLGSEGHGLVSSVLLGSVSAKVLHYAPCSVLIVR